MLDERCASKTLSGPEAGLGNHSCNGLEVVADTCGLAGMGGGK